MWGEGGGWSGIHGVKFPSLYQGTYTDRGGVGGPTRAHRVGRHAVLYSALIPLPPHSAFMHLLLAWFGTYVLQEGNTTMAGLPSPC